MANRIRILLLLLIFFSLPLMLGMIGDEEDKRTENANNSAQIIAIKSSDDEKNGEKAEEILSEFSGLLPESKKELATIDGLRSAIGFEAIFAEFLGSADGAFSRIFYFLAACIGVAVILSVCEIVWTSGDSLVRLPVSSAAALAVYNMLLPVVSEVSGALTSVSEFFSGLSGVLTGLTLSLGGVGLASVQASGMLFTLSVYGSFSGSFLMSVVTMVFATALVGASCSGKAQRLASGVKTVFNVGLGILTAALLGLLSLQSLIAGASDSAGLRAARYAVSGLVPIVGSTVSSALATLSSGLSYVGHIVGGASVAVILSITLAPAIILLLYRLALSLVLMLLDFTGAKNATSVFKALRGALDTLISVYFMSSVVYIFEIVLFVKCGVGLV